MAKVRFTETALRDAHQSLLATRMRTRDMVPVAEELDKVGYYSIEAWGGATFDTCIRYLNEDPWERLRQLKSEITRTPIQMLLRGQNLVGYKHYPDDIVTKFVEKSYENGVDIFRVFDALNDILPTEIAVVDAKFKEKLKGVTEGYKDSLSAIRLTSYEPNRLVYKTSSAKDGVVVFSEIYYPGWQATIDGQPVDIARADYVLRVMNIPAGEHTIEMWFDPQSIHVTESIAYAALALLLIGVMILVWMSRSRISKKS